MTDQWKDARTQATIQGTLMRQGREQQSISQAKLAHILDPDGIYKNITVPNVSRWENGELIPPAFVAELIHDWLLQARPGYELRFPTPARATDPETSHENAPSTNTQVHWAICEILRMYPDGLTDFEIKQKYASRLAARSSSRQLTERLYPDVTEQRLRTARAELVTAHRAHNSGQTRTNDRERNCIVWRYTVSTDWDQHQQFIEAQRAEFDIDERELYEPSPYDGTYSED